LKKIIKKSFSAGQRKATCFGFNKKLAILQKC